MKADGLHFWFVLRSWQFYHSLANATLKSGSIIIFYLFTFSITVKQKPKNYLQSHPKCTAWIRWSRNEIIYIGTGVTLAALSVVVTAVTAAAWTHVMIWMTKHWKKPQPGTFSASAQSPIKLSELGKCDEWKAWCVCVFILSLGYHHPQRRAIFYYAVSTYSTEGANWIGVTVCTPGATSWWAPTNKLDWWCVNLKQFDEPKGQIEFSTM